MIKRVLDEEYASYCDCLLTKLIHDEKQYDDSIDSKFVVRDYFKNIIKNNDHILLCYIENNKIVGYIYLKPVKCNNKNGYLIDGLYVEEDFRNKGIATSLIDESLKILSNFKIEFIDINVLSNNEIAKFLYNSFGFNEFKIQMRKNL